MSSNRPSCRIANSASESISICNAGKTADVFDISGKMMLRIANAYIHDCRIANSAERTRRHSSVFARSVATWQSRIPYHVCPRIARSGALGTLGPLGTLGLCGALDCHVASLLAMTGGGWRPPLFAAVGAGRHETIPSCRICNSAAESISICNAGKTADVFDIFGMMMLRIANAYIHDCRIANSAGRVVACRGVPWRAATIAVPCAPDNSVPRNDDEVSDHINRKRIPTLAERRRCSTARPGCALANRSRACLPRDMIRSG
jgi:hypothetical protein